MSEQPVRSFMELDDKSSRRKKSKQRGDKNRDGEEKTSPLKRVKSRLFGGKASSSSSKDADRPGSSQGTKDADRRPGSSRGTKEGERRPGSSRGREQDQSDTPRPSTSRSHRRTPSASSVRTMFAAPRPGEGDVPPLPAGFSYTSASESQSTLPMRPRGLTRTTTGDNPFSQSPSHSPGGSPQPPSSFRTQPSSASLRSAFSRGSSGLGSSIGNDRALVRRADEAENSIVAYRLTLARIHIIENLLAAICQDPRLSATIDNDTLLISSQIATLRQSLVNLRTVAGELVEDSTPERYDDVNAGTTDQSAAITNLARRDADGAVHRLDGMLYGVLNAWQPRMGGPEL